MLELYAEFDTAEGRKGRKFTRADLFLKDMISVVGASDFAGMCGKSEKELNAAIKKSQSKFVFTDEQHPLPLACIKKGDTSAKVLKGTSADGAKLKEAAKKNSDGSILDFTCVLSTTSPDRDGDVLHAKGARLDPMMPVLLQHLAFQPLGKMYSELERNEKQIMVHAGLADVALAKDAATLVEFGGLRISHGFFPIDYDRRKDDNGNELNGWEIKVWNCMEMSLVSIPANPEAVITAFSRDKLHTPLMKGWGQALFRKRATIGKGVNIDADGNVVSGSSGSTNVNLTIKLNGLGMALKSEGEDDEEDEDDEDENEESKEADGSEEDENENEGDKSGESPLTNLVASLDKALADEGLPQEAKDRITTAKNMIVRVMANAKASGKAYNSAAKKGDIGGMFLEVASLSDNVLTGVKNAAEELERCSTITGIDEAKQGLVDDAYVCASTVWKEVSAAAGIDDEEGDHHGDDESVSGSDQNQNGTSDEDKDFDSLLIKMTGMILDGKATSEQKENLLALATQCLGEEESAEAA